MDVKIQVKAIDGIAILEEYGSKLREPYSKALKDGIFELRLIFSSDTTRIFYFFYVGNKIILTNGFIEMLKPPAMLG